MQTFHNQESKDLSEADFRQLISDFDKHFDSKFITKLKVLFIELIDDLNDLNNSTRTIIELCTHLHGSGKLSRTDLSVLYDTIIETKQFGFQSEIKKKASCFQKYQGT